MSAFIVSDQHIEALVAYGIRHNIEVATLDGELIYSFVVQEDAIKMHNELVAENYRSVKARYGATETEVPVLTALDPRMVIPHYSHAQIYKACHCLEYQSCETRDYYDTFGYRIVRTIENHAAYSIISAMPEYDKAQWEIHHE